jgi:hypothetical protein
MKRPLLALGALSLVLSFSMTQSGCAGALSPPFADMKSQPVTVFRLQNYEQPQAASPAAAPGIPPQIQQWLTAGAQMLPPGLLPPGLLPGGTPAPATNDVPRFHKFRILGSMPVNDKTLHDDILDLVGHESNFVQPRESCMFAEFGFQVGFGSPPGAPPGTPPAGGQPPADILISLSCNQVQMIGYAWPYGTKNGLTPESSKRVIAIVQKAFGS